MHHLLMGGMAPGLMGRGMTGFFVGFMLRRLIMRLFMICLLVAVVYFFVRWQLERARNENAWWRGPDSGDGGWQ